MPTLSIQLPGLPPVSHVLKDETITIGRMKGNTIVIEDSSISLMHAKITRKNGDFLLKDLNSTNGTSVNAQPIGEVKLRDQDRVRFAEISCQYLADAVPVEPVAPVATTAAATAPAPVLQPAFRAAVAAPAIPAVPTAKSSHPKPPRRALFPVLRYAGAVLAIGVVSLVGWRFFQLNQGSSNKSENPLPTTTLPPAPRALTQGKMRTVAPKQDNDSVKPVSKIPGAVSEMPNNELPVPDALTERTAESKVEGIPQLVEALKSDDVTGRQRAAAALHSLGAEAKKAIPALREALADKDQDVQMWAALALVNNQDFDKRVVPVLVRALQNDNPVLRQVACLSLGLIPYLESEKGSVVPALTDTANKDGNDDVRKAALSALSIIAPDVIVKTAAK